LVLTALAPGVGLAYLTRLEDRHREMAQVHETELRLADLIALEEARLVNGIRLILISASQSPAVTSADRTACSSWLKRLLGHIERSDNLNLAVADIDGNVVCSAVPLTRPVNAADRSYFRAAVEHGGFSVGAYQEGRILGRPAVNFGYPIVDDRGTVGGVVFVEFDLQRLHELEEEVGARLPPHATLTKIDTDGRVLARLPDPGKTVGQVAFSAPVLGRIFAAPNGVFVQPDPGGESHLYAFSSVPSKATGGRMFVALDFPEAVAFAAASRGLRWKLLVLALGAVLALALTWLVSERLIVGPAKRVAGAVHRLATGDLTVRSGLRHEGAIGDLAGALDELAASLERREAERRVAEEGLRASEERYRSLFENATDIVFTLDGSGRLTSVNRAGKGEVRIDQRKTNLGLPREVHFPTPRLAAAAALLAVALSPPPGAFSADPDLVALPAALASFLADEAHASASDRDLLLAGEPFIKLLDADPAREVAVLGALWVNAPSTLYVQQLKRIEELERGRAFPITKRISEPPVPEDFAAMEMSGKDFDDLKGCKIGDCLVKLDAEAMRTLRAEVDWSRPTAKAEAAAVFRRLALQYVDAYREGGNARLAVYRDKDRPAFVASEFRSMIDRLPRLAGEWLDLKRYLLEYPEATLPNSSDFLCWQEVQFGLRPTIRINHLVIQERPDLTVVASKMLYASHYFWTALELRVLLADPARGPGFWLVTVTRSRSDALGGFTGRAIRGRVRTEAQNGMRAALTGVKRRLESLARQPSREAPRLLIERTKT
jgi:PAS domain-containing protein